jgi:succinoglycan biosynthesis transport protein ExoP
MNNGRNIQTPPPSISLADIYFVVFRHKWKIIILTLLGVAAGATYYVLKQPPFQSQAELLVRYIADKRQASPADGAKVTSVVDMGDSIMADEVSIIRSFDLAETVATNVGPEKILAKLGGGNDSLRAASVISENLTVEVSHESSVIRITFSHPDQTVVQTVVAAYIEAYYDKHQHVHAAIGISDDLLTEQAQQLSEQVAQTERELVMAKTNAGIIDFDDAEKAYSEENSRLRSELLQAKAELAEHLASTGSNLVIPGSKSKGAGDAAAQQILPLDLVERYKSVCATLRYLQKKHDDYLSVQGYTEENRLVQEVSAKLIAAARTKDGLEEKNPSLATLDLTLADATTESTGASAGDIDYASLPAKIQTLKDQLEEVQAESAKLEDAGAKISGLEHKKAVQESNLKYFETTLQQEQIDEALGPGQVSNIPQIERPTAPYKDYAKFYKKIFGLCFGGLFLGLGWAFLIEMFLDRSIKRPIEIQTKLKIPFFLSIPDLSQGNSKRLMPANRQLGYNANSANGSGNGNGSSKPAKTDALELAKWEINRRFDSYYDALRDRLVVYFESINLTRKPKLVAVTSTHKGSGVSTIAAGLAASLSETGDGRVLLVDMNEEKGAAQQFFRGEASCKLDDALTSDKRDNALVQDNLYVVTEDTISDKLPRALPRRFASLIPKLKASDYDYIIFDMPPVSPTSVTSRLAGFMDTVMLVIESEKSDQQVVQQAHALLAQSKANVTAVLNKTKTYIPARLHQDFLSDS